MSVPWLAEVLTGAGLVVRETDGWGSRGRPGSFSPSGVLLHHTGSGTPSSQSNPHPNLNNVINGRTDLAGPLCQVLIDWVGRCHTIAAGRANHAGVARASGPMPAGDGNTLYVGIEIDYSASGTNPPQEMSPAQYDAAITASAAIIGRLGTTANHVRGHLETSETGKIDPQYVSMETIRTAVGGRL